MNDLRVACVHGRYDVHDIKPTWEHPHKPNPYENNRCPGGRQVTIDYEAAYKVPVPDIGPTVHGIRWGGLGGPYPRRYRCCSRDRRHRMNELPSRELVTLAIEGYRKHNEWLPMLVWFAEAWVSGRLVDREVTDSCPGNDPTCPGHDHGDPCHYRSVNGDVAFSIGDTDDTD